MRATIDRAGQKAAESFSLEAEVEAWRIKRSRLFPWPAKSLSSASAGVRGRRRCPVRQQTARSRSRRPSDANASAANVRYCESRGQKTGC